MIEVKYEDNYQLLVCLLFVFLPLLCGNALLIRQPCFMKIFKNFLFSTRTMAFLFIIYAVAMGVATFIENDYGTPAAKAIIYEAKWFELVMVLLMLNFVGNIARYRLWKREKWPLLAFHLSFVFIFLGGAITRYISFEGLMLIREGGQSNEIISERQYLKVQIEQKGDVQTFPEVPYLMSPLSYGIRSTYDFNGQHISVRGIDYVLRKKDSLVAGTGKEYLHLVSTADSGRQNIYLAPGEVKSVNGFLVTYGRPIAGAIEFYKQNGQMFIKTPMDANYMTMATQATGTQAKNTLEPLKLRSLYSIDRLRIVVPEMPSTGRLISVTGDKRKDANLPDVLTMEVKGPKTTQVVEIPVQKGNVNMTKQITLDGYNMILGFGSKIIHTPFYVKLNKFVMETYPGSDSPSAYESHINIIDEGKSVPHKIYMNNVLDYKGYRLFQSGFDPDRKGTRLQVNHDFWGTWITYIGYIILFFGMFISLFWKGTYFWKLNSQLGDLAKKKSASLGIIALMTGGIFNAQSLPTPRTVTANDLVKSIQIDKDHADRFGSLLVQTYEGRIAPINTQALDVLHKLTKKESFQHLNANQWFLAVSVDPMFWAQVDLIKVETKGQIGERIKQKTRANEEGYTSLIKLFPADVQGNLRFVLEEDYNIAFRKKTGEQNKYDQAVIKLNDNVQAMNALMSWQYFRVVPIKNDPNHTWTSVMNGQFEPDANAQQVLGPYLSKVLLATQSGKWGEANRALKDIKDYQQIWGKSVVPSESRVKVELLMNKLNLNFVLMIFYSVISALLLVLGFVELFAPRRILHTIIRGLLGLGILGYIAHFLGMAARWYISGHAPWSNGYEAIMFISWVGITAGLSLYRNGNALIPSAGFLVAVVMMGFAHGGAQLDPQITPLVPVLKSYWLIIHVAIITSSYGFFALCMIIGIMSLLFYLISNKKAFKKHNPSTIRELHIVSEMSMTIGLYTLTIGTFMGGIWANESWGRYWSWDPKETWAFISVMVYAFILHMRLVPGLRGRYAFHFAAMVGFSTIVMSYFGVNYYLSGLHSYAAGDPIPVPLWVYIAVAFMVVLGISSFMRYKQNMNKS